MPPKRECDSDKTCKLCNRNFLGARGSNFCDSCKRKTCSICAKEYSVKPRLLGKSKYCSRDCQRRGYSKHVFTDADIDWIKRNYPRKVSFKELLIRFPARTRLQQLLSREGLYVPADVRSERARAAKLVYTPEVIISTLESEAQKGTTRNELLSNFGGLYTALVRGWGTIENALSTLGYSERFPYVVEWWTDTSVVEKIRERFLSGKTLSPQIAQQEVPKLYSAANRYFSSWRRACLAAGVPYDRLQKAERGRRRYIGNDGHSYASFGESKLADALSQLKTDGLLQDYKPHVRICEDRHWTCDFVLLTTSDQFLYLEYDGLGLARRGEEYHANNPKISYYRERGLPYAILPPHKNFRQAVLDVLRGSEATIVGRDWDNFYSVGNLRYTDEEILAEVRSVGTQAGTRIVTTSLFDRLSTRMTSQTVRNRFGWNNAVELAGLLPFEGASSHCLIAELKRVASLLGRCPTTRDFREASEYDPCRYANVFGSWVNALSAAGFKEEAGRRRKSKN